MIDRMFKKSTLAGVVCFSLLSVYHIILNLQIPCMRSLPDEMGAVALGAKLAGYNWNYVMTHPEMYYGSANVIFAFPIFLLVKEPVMQYQLLLSAAAFMKAATGFIAVKISMDHYNVSGLRAVLFGIICTLITPARTSNIDNEPMLILMCWVILYVTLILSKTDNKKKKVILTVLLSFFLAYAQFAHTRAIMYIFLLAGILVIYYFFEKETIINIPAFFISFMIFYTIVKRGISWCTLNLFTAFESQNMAMINTFDNLMHTIVDNLKSLVRPVEIRSCVDIICGNIWCTAVFSCGALVYISILVIKELCRNLKLFFERKEMEREDILYYLALFGVIGVLATMAALSITWKESVVELHEKASGIPRGLFYLRYYGNYFGIIMLYFLILWDRGKLYNRQVLNGTIGIIAGCYFYSFVSYVTPLLGAGYANLDWFGYFAPLSMTGASWEDKRQTLFYFTNATFIAATIFIIMTGLKWRKYLCFILAAVLLYQYSFNVHKWDAEYANSDYYYQASNGIYKLKKDYPEIFDSINKMYYFSDNYGSQYIVQFMMGKIEIILQDAYKEDDEVMILADKEIEDIDLSAYKYLVIDENEIMYVKGVGLQEKISREDLVLQD